MSSEDGVAQSPPLDGTPPTGSRFSPSTAQWQGEGHTKIIVALTSAFVGSPSLSRESLRAVRSSVSLAASSHPGIAGSSNDLDRDIELAVPRHQLMVLKRQVVRESCLVIGSSASAWLLAAAPSMPMSFTSIGGCAKRAEEVRRPLWRRSPR